MSLKQILSELVYPKGIKCVVCGDELPRTIRYCVCEKCELSFNTKFCSRCGRAMSNMASYCEVCKAHKHKFTMARAPFVYENEVVKLVHKLKFGGGKYLAEVMAEFMTDTYLENDMQADVVTFVPMHEKRRKQRGYNQAEEIANIVAKRLGLPVVELLNRVKDTSALAKMSKKERADAIIDAFEINGSPKIRNKRILLIDDVFTSGATTEECARILKSKRCSDIYILTFATSRVHVDLP